MNNFKLRKFFLMLLCLIIVTSVSLGATGCGTTQNTQTTQNVQNTQDTQSSQNAQNTQDTQNSQNVQSSQSTQNTQGEISQKTGDMVVVDAAGTDVEVKDDIQKVAITCYGGTANELCVLGASDLIVAQPSMKKFPQLLKMYPRFNDIIDPGSFDDVNIEEIVNVSPDLVLCGISSKDGNAKIREAGYDTYTMLIGWAAVDTLKQEFLNVGKLIGKEERAEKLVSYWDEKIALVESAVAKVPESERKVVYYTGKTITDANSSGWTWPMIETCGGKSALPKDHNGEVNVEEVINWNPDVIITQGNNGTEGLTSDARVVSVKAIKDNAVYECPIAAFWWDRPSPESPLGFMWLAKTLYPEYTQDIDLEKETKEFFKEFYDYELSSEEYQSFFFQ